MGHFLCPSSFEVFSFGFIQNLFNFGGTQGTLRTRIILSYRNFVYCDLKSVNGTLFVSLEFWSVFFWFFFKLILILEGHKGHFEHGSFLATGTLPTLTTSNLMGHFLCPSSFEVVFSFKPFLIFEGHKGHFEHKSFLAKGTLLTLTTSQLMGHLLCPSSFEVVYFFVTPFFNSGGTQGTLWTQTTLSSRHTAKSVNGTLLVTLESWSDLFWFFSKRF